jgi:hypothetical protein
VYACVVRVRVCEKLFDKLLLDFEAPRFIAIHIFYSEVFFCCGWAHSGRTIGSMMHRHLCHCRGTEAEGL